jgi:hypothetical protein
MFKVTASEVFDNQCPIFGNSEPITDYRLPNTLDLKL